MPHPTLLEQGLALKKTTVRRPIERDSRAGNRKNGTLFDTLPRQYDSPTTDPGVRIGHFGVTFFYG